jgi:hypothetical protein
LGEVLWPKRAVAALANKSTLVQTSARAPERKNDEDSMEENV